MAVSELKEFHRSRGANPLLARPRLSVSRASGYSADASSLKEKELLSGHTRLVAYRFIPLGRETMKEIGPAW